MIHFRYDINMPSPLWSILPTVESFSTVEGQCLECMEHSSGAQCTVRVMGLEG